MSGAWVRKSLLVNIVLKRKNVYKSSHLYVVPGSGYRVVLTCPLTPIWDALESRNKYVDPRRYAPHIHVRRIRRFSHKRINFPALFGANQYVQMQSRTY